MMIAEGPIRKCPGCGAIVALPCLTCSTRELEAGGSLSRPSGTEEPPFLCLSAEHQERYEEIRVQKVELAMQEKPLPVETQIIPFPPQVDNHLRLWDI
jgi:hypothetical protein